MSCMKRLQIILLSILLVAQGCKIADLRTAAIDTSFPDRETRALQLLEEVIAANQLRKLAEAETYSLEATDNWKGLLAVMNPLPKDNTVMALRFRPNSFDGQLKYLDGDNKTVHGVQSFRYYKIKDDGAIKLRNKKSIVFALPAIQYFFELPLRLHNAPFLKYAGTATVEGKKYDLVFATWQELAPHKEHDQYLLYINKATRQLDFANYTVRGLYLPAPKSLYGSIRFSNRKTTNYGITYPGTMTIQLNSLKKEKRFAHRIATDKLELNSFNVLDLYPIQGLQYLGDQKN